MRNVLRAMPSLRPRGLALPTVALGAAVSLGFAALPALGAGTGAAAVAAAVPKAAPPTPSALLNQRLSWRECLPGAGFPRLQCASMAAPADWNRPAGGRIKIALSRVLAGNKAGRRGLLLTNPGGPGEGGLVMPLFINVAEPDVASAFDVVGMDPRGTGASTPLSCVSGSLRAALYDLDGRDLSGANQKAIATLSKQFATRCAKTSFTRTVNTFQTVRDLDLVRAVLHEKKISYLGYSAGTWLGAWYATTFPTRVDRMLLDANVDFTAPWYPSFARQPAGFQASFEKYFQPWVAHYSDLYGQGSTTAEVKRTYEARRLALTGNPLTLPNGTLLTGVGFDNGIAAGLYYTGNYPDLAAAISILGHWDNATPEDQAIVLRVFGGGSMISSDVFWAITCQDTKNPTPARLLADTAVFRKAAPLTGASWNVNPCAYWPGKPIGSPVTGKNLPPILMLNNAADPATPLANARLARKHTPSAVLVTVSAQPDHTIYGGGNPCVERIANSWLLDRVRPRTDVVCPGLPLPDPTQAITPPPVPVPVPAPAAAGSASKTELSVPVYRAPSTATAQEKPHGDTGGSTTVEAWLARFMAFYGTPQVG